LRKHIENNHAAEFRKIIAERGWKFQLPSDKKSATVETPAQEDRPDFTPELFLEYLVNFIVANDQVHCCFIPNVLTHRYY
jgi:hypothetical protein